MISRMVWLCKTAPNQACNEQGFALGVRAGLAGNRSGLRGSLGRPPCIWCKPESSIGKAARQVRVRRARNYPR